MVTAAASLMARENESAETPTRRRLIPGRVTCAVTREGLAPAAAAVSRIEGGRSASDRDVSRNARGMTAIVTTAAAAVKTAIAVRPESAGRTTVAPNHPNTTAGSAAK